jgi:hypothetical protein
VRRDKVVRDLDRPEARIVTRLRCSAHAIPPECGVDAPR